MAVAASILTAVLCQIAALSKGETLSKSVIRKHEVWNSSIVDAQGHVVNDFKEDAHQPAPSQLLQRDAGDLKVMYAVMTNNGEHGQAQLKAQMNTWAESLIKESRFVAITASQYGSAQSKESGPVIEAPCSDDYNRASSGIPCKELHSLKAGYDRAADWLVRVDDDNYVDTAAVDRALASLPRKDVEAPLVLALSLGCGRGDAVIRAACPEVAETGGICGGGGYALNRAALKELQTAGWPQLMKEYQALQRSGMQQGDVITSCELMQRGIPIRKMKGLTSINNVQKLTSWKSILQQRPMTYHNVSPRVMRWVHANLREGVDQDLLASLESKAFEKSCCCWKSERDKVRCQTGLLQEIGVLDGSTAIQCIGSGCSKERTAWHLGWSK